jgi:hypothetical protein
VIGHPGDAIRGKFAANAAISAPTDPARRRLIDSVNLNVYIANMTATRSLAAMLFSTLFLLTLSSLQIGQARASSQDGDHPARPPFQQLLAPEQLTGEVVELLPTGSYQYVRLIEPEGGELWVATLRGALELGPAEVTVYGWRTAFVSRRLARTFDRLAFGVVHPLPTPRRL